MSQCVLYLAGGLFNAGERLHNLFLERALKKLGYEVVLPQREVLAFSYRGVFNIPAIVENCRRAASNSSMIYVGNADGPDADSGTCVEYGIAITTTGQAIVYRTDFRTALEQELGVNAMLRAEGTTFIYQPCFFTELDQVEPYYDQLAQEIHQAVEKISVEGKLADRGEEKISCGYCGHEVEIIDSYRKCPQCGSITV